MSVEWFENLFKKKIEDSMQRRAEESRERVKDAKKKQAQLDEVTTKLEKTFIEISKSNKKNG